jgi:hypothetical protein
MASSSIAIVLLIAAAFALPARDALSGEFYETPAWSAWKRNR